MQGMEQVKAKSLKGFLLCSFFFFKWEWDTCESRADPFVGLFFLLPISSLSLFVLKGTYVSRFNYIILYYTILYKVKYKKLFLLHTNIFPLRSPLFFFFFLILVLTLYTTTVSAVGIPYWMLRTKEMSKWCWLANDDDLEAFTFLIKRRTRIWIDQLFRTRKFEIEYITI